MKILLKLFVLGIGLYLTVRNIPLTGGHTVTVGLVIGVIFIFWAIASLLAQKKEQKESGDWNHMATKPRR